MPNPRRIYPFMEGLSMDACFEAAHEVVQVETTLQSGTKSLTSYSFARGNGSFQAVTVGNTAIVDLYEQSFPIVAKCVTNNEVVFLLQDLGANEGQVTKVKVVHGSKTYFLAANSDEPKIYKFTI